MSGTQIALIVVGIFLVVLAIFVGVTAVRENPAEANDQAVFSEAADIMAAAENWYKQAGGRTFAGITLEELGGSPSTENGAYRIENATDLAIQVLATGKGDRDKDGKPLEYRFTYNALSDTTSWQKLEE
jgi:hypothetical protein